VKVLILYSSGYGATKEVSQEIGRMIEQEKGFQVSVQSIDEANEIAKYDAIIVGSSVRADRPLANVRDFFARYRYILPEKKIALFAVCLTAKDAKGREKVEMEYISQITNKYPKLEPVKIGAFGGKIDFDKLNPVMKELMVHVLEKTGIPTTGSVDTRDWAYIHKWALDLRKELLEAQEF